MPVDPRVSEWGNPAGRTPATARRTHRRAGGTRGTETSKYPEEEKETSMPGVAASETGGAQTGARARRGMDRRKAPRPQRNGFGKAGRRG